MNNNPFIEAREQLPSVIRTLPLDYLDSNAAALLGIIDELRRSYQVELRNIQLINELDVSNQAAVNQLTTDFKYYIQYRDFDEERTHCHRIEWITRSMLIPFQAQTRNSASIDELNRLLKILGDADLEFTGDIEQVMNRALETLQRINALVQASLADPTQLAAASQERQAFVDEFDSEVARLKAVLRRMNQLSLDLIDRL